VYCFYKEKVRKSVPSRGPASFVTK